MRRAAWPAAAACGLLLAGCDKPAIKPPAPVQASAPGPTPLENPRWRMDYSQPQGLAAFYAPGESDNLFYRVECLRDRLTLLIYLEPVPTTDVPPFLEIAVRGPDRKVAAFARGRTRLTEEGWAADVILLNPFFSLADEQPGLQVKVGSPDDDQPHWTTANDVVRDVVMLCANRVAN